MEQKRDREQQRRRDKSSKDSKRGRINKMDGKSSAPWRSGEMIEREGMAEKSSSSTTANEIVSEVGNKSGGDFSRRQIESNWSKYEAILPGGNDDVSKASDFESLVSAPISEGGHFKFKSEQSWETYSPSQFNNLFTLDLNMLSTSLSTIPFYNQLNLSKEIFSQDELNRMDKEADENHARYLSLKETGDMVSRTVPNINTSRSSDRIAEPPQSHAIIKGLADLKLASHADSEDSASPENIENSTMRSEELLESEKDDELDFLLALKEPLELPVTLSIPPAELGGKAMKDESKLLVPSSSSESKQEDLDDWLDSILDD